MKRLRELARLVARTPLHPQWLLGRRRLPATFESRTHGAILDIGAGDRWIENKLPRGVHYIALDYPAAGGKFYGSRPDVLADAVSLPFADSSLDTVFCLEVLEHVPDPDKVMQEIARVLKPGASAWLSMPFLYPVHDAPFDFQRFTEFGILFHAKRAGLELVDVRSSLNAVSSAGLLVNLAVVGGLQQCRPWMVLALALPAATIVFAVNLGSYLLGLVWPGWPALTAGHDFEVRRR